MNWSKAWEGIKTIFKGIWQSFKAIAAEPLNWIINKVNGVISGINSFKVPDWVPGLGGKSTNIPTIPKLATGSQYTKAGLTLVGEHGPEIVNMPGGAKVNTNSQTNKILGNNGDIKVFVTVQGNVIGNESFIDQVGNAIYNKVSLALVNM